MLRKLVGAAVHLPEVRTTDKGLPRMRADARNNRERVVESARILFAEKGLGVTVREIARRAGVGPATLYRGSRAVSYSSRKRSPTNCATAGK